MKRLLILSMISLNSFSATLGIPNIIMPSSMAATPAFIRSANQSGTSDDVATTKLVQQQMTNFSAQVRGKIIQSKYFQVIDVDSNTALNYLNQLESQPQVTTLAPKAASETIAESMPKVESSAAVNQITAIKPKQPSADYLLIGTVSAIDASEDVNPIIDTNKYSAIYSIDLAVDYKLVSVKDHKMIASFTAAGHAGDVKLTSNPGQKMSHNIPKLVQQVGNDLAQEVMNQLAIQLENGKVVHDTPESVPKVTDVKVYTN